MRATKIGMTLTANRGRAPASQACLLAAGVFGAACAPFSDEPAEYLYECGASAEVAYETAGGEDTRCGEGDPNLPPEPTLPSEVCQTLKANKAFPDEERLDTERLQAAFDACKGTAGAVKLVTDGENNAFVSAHLDLDSVTLWIDEGVTLFVSRQAELFQKTGGCGKPGLNDSGACQDFISVMGTSPAIVGDGVIDGQAAEPLVGHDYSWWQLSGALRKINGSIGNPTLVNLLKGTTGFVMYRITMHDSPKFHVKISSNPPLDTSVDPPVEEPCDEPGKGFIVWGVTILTPKSHVNSQGLPITAHFARNTDGIDPGTTSKASCGVIACNTVSTSDDQIAIKGGHLVKDLIIAHNHFGTGHGMSIGSETYGEEFFAEDGVTRLRGVQDVLVYDLTIDADSRGVGHDSSDADFNGIRIKSDISRGGLVDNIRYRDVCMRDMNNAILISTAYNPLFAGNEFPEFGRITFENVRHVSCMNTDLPVVTMEGHGVTRRAGPIKLDNVIIDNISPNAVDAEYADFELGPGDVNFRPAGTDVTVVDNIQAGSAPPRCKFPSLPAPKLPKGYLR